MEDMALTDVRVVGGMEDMALTDVWVCGEGYLKRVCSTGNDFSSGKPGT